MIIYVATVNNTKLAFLNENDALHFALDAYQHYLVSNTALSENDKEALYEYCKSNLVILSPFEISSGFSAHIEILPLIE